MRWLRHGGKAQIDDKATFFPSPDSPALGGLDGWAMSESDDDDVYVYDRKLCLREAAKDVASKSDGRANASSSAGRRAQMTAQAIL